MYEQKDSGIELYSQTDKLTIPAATGTTILRATLEAGINHTHVCGGNARCTTCRVLILEGLENCLPRNEKELRLARQLGFPDHIRLACQTKITGPVTFKRSVVDELDINIIMKQIGDESGTRLGKEVELAVLFLDIENYTRFAEAYPAYDVVHVLNRYYQTMNRIIEQHQGVISDVAGDGILALFGVLRETPNPVLDAVLAVKAMNQALIGFNRYLEQMFDRSFGIRAGINYGRAVIGSFDTGLMSKISAIGDAVNLAGRIEEANKDLGTRLLLSESAFKRIKERVASSRAYQAELKGKSGRHTLYQVELKD
ncbi:MAG: adenylate/guanylate cyclase domain-containing protein [Desulfohalobiaceae bacterium]|nr:adenylate/guanylate cyclase domain-containing protein [Desulfohalobiaceae bacterium]